jgi:hypothetical protein
MQRLVGVYFKVEATSQFNIQKMTEQFNDSLQMALTQELTYGQKAVGATFNPSNNPHVDFIKRQFAFVIDELHLEREKTNDPEKKRLFSIAITEAQGAQMWAVKAVTWQ